MSHSPDCKVYRTYPNDDTEWLQSKLDRGEDIRYRTFNITKQLVFRGTGTMYGCHLRSRFPPNVSSWFIIEGSFQITEKFWEMVQDNLWVED